MKNRYKPIDEHFREVLSQHTVTPTEEARRAFLKEAANITPTRRKSGVWLWWLTLILIPAGASVLTWIALSDDNEPGLAVQSSLRSIPRMENTLMDYPAGQTLVQIPELQTDALERMHSAKQKTQPDRQNQPGTAPDINWNYHQTSEPEPVTPSQPIPFEPSSEIISATESREPPHSVTDFDTAHRIPDIENPVSLTTPDTLAPDTSLPNPAQNTLNTRGERPRSTKLSLQLGAGISWSPEWMFNTLEGTKNIHTFALEGIFSIGPYSIRTGAGLHIGKGTNEVLIEYHDYLGGYNKLDSMDFNYNTITQKYVPVYYLSRREVWDSLMKTDQTKIVKRYTYLQIPMILGYDFLRNERFSLGMRLGPQLSVLLSTKQLSAPYDPGKNMVVRVNDISPGQIELNWQVLAGLNASVKLSEKLRLELEPFAKYYFNSVYEKPANQEKPWSVGIRTALVIDL